MKVFLDTNVVSDVLLERAPWMAHADAIWQAACSGQIESFVSASAITDIYYIARKIVGETEVLAVVHQCLDVLAIIGIDSAILWYAARHPGIDFEDSVQVAAAVRANADLM